MIKSLKKKKYLVPYPNPTRAAFWLFPCDLSQTFVIPQGIEGRSHSEVTFDRGRAHGAGDTVGTAGREIGYQGQAWPRASGGGSGRTCPQWVTSHSLPWRLVLIWTFCVLEVFPCQCRWLPVRC